MDDENLSCAEVVIDPIILNQQNYLNKNDKIITDLVDQVNKLQIELDKIKQAKQKESSKNLKKTLKKCLLNTSFHGIPPLFRSEIFFMRISWLICILCALAGSTWFIEQSVTEFLDYETITQNQVITKKYVKFPAIYVCHKLSDTPIESFIFQCSFNNQTFNCKDKVELVNSTDMVGNIRRCYKFNGGKNFTGHPVDINNSTMIGYRNGFHLYMYLPNTFVNYYIGDYSFTPIRDEIYRFFEGGYTGNIIIHKMIQKKINSPRFPCMPDSISQNYRKIECNQICFQRSASRICNCTFDEQNLLLERCTNKESTKKCVADLNTKFQSEVNECSSLCPLECESVAYSIITQAVTYNPEKTRLAWWRDQLTKELNVSDVTDKLIKKSVLSLYFLFSDMTYTETHEILKTTTSDLVSNIGGTIGIKVK